MITPARASHVSVRDRCVLYRHVASCHRFHFAASESWGAHNSWQGRVGAVRLLVNTAISPLTRLRRLPRPHRWPPLSATLAAQTHLDGIEKTS